MSAIIQTRELTLDQKVHQEFFGQCLHLEHLAKLEEEKQNKRNSIQGINPVAYGYSCIECYKNIKMHPVPPYSVETPHYMKILLSFQKKWVEVNIKYFHIPMVQSRNGQERLKTGEITGYYTANTLARQQMLICAEIIDHNIAGALCDLALQYCEQQKRLKSI